ncbi:MAG: prepilin-type N-terminal cleavage/methylation domain-containing protein [bacterium]|nr:prepilin-type N-terminal cleavage/methylation domain-containing protein [bacterium]
MKIKQRKGFTVTEVMVTLIIIGIATAAILYSYTRFIAGSAVDAAARDIKGTLDLARNFAIAVNSTHRVTFQLHDPNPGTSGVGNRQSFWIDRYALDTAGNPFWQKQVTDPRWVPDSVLITDVSDSTATYEYIEFYPDGTAQAKIIHLIGRNDNQSIATNFYSIEVYPSTAISKIYAHQKK